MHFAAKAILFDLDGVLADSTHAVDRSWEVWAQRHDIDPKRAIAVGHGRPSIEAIRIIAPHLDAEAAFAEMEELEESFIDSVQPVHGAAEFVARVSELGIPWAVATSGTRRIAIPRLRKAQIPDPPVLIAADDITHGKPHPEPYEKAAGALGVAPWDCLVFEDAPAGVLSARRAGARVIGIGSSGSPPSADDWAADFKDAVVHTASETAVVEVLRTRYRCACCRCHTLGAHGGNDICALCKWEDGTQERSDYTLDEARENVQLHGVMYRPTDVRFAPGRHPILGPTGEYAIDRVALRQRAYREFRAFGADKGAREHLPERLRTLLAAIRSADRLYTTPTL